MFYWWFEIDGWWRQQPWHPCSLKQPFACSPCLGAPLWTVLACLGEPHMACGSLLESTEPEGGGDAESWSAYDSIAEIWMRHRWLLVKSDAERRRGMKGMETSTKSRERARSKSQRGFFIRDQIKMSRPTTGGWASRLEASVCGSFFILLYSVNWLNHWGCPKALFSFHLKTLHPITSDVWTHAWSIKYRLKK
jgi:hypothetical protein